MRLEIIFNLVESVSQKFYYLDRSIKKEVSSIFRKERYQKKERGREVDLEIRGQTSLINYASKSTLFWLDVTLMTRGGTKIIKSEAYMSLEESQHHITMATRW